MPFMRDGLSTLYQDLLSGSYDCVDRIVLNAYFRMGHDPGGFRLWWRQLTGSDATLDNAHVMRLAGRFGRRIRGYAKANDIPVVNCSAGERKHDIAEDYLARTKITQGLFLVLVGRAQAPVWDVSANHHIEKKKPMPYVNHYSFHILDAEWGHITIKISGHPPFPAQIMLNATSMSPARPVRQELPSPSKAIALPMSLALQPWRKSQRPCPNHGR